MTMYLLYCGLLMVWTLLLWPAFHLQGRARGWLLLVIFAAIAALIHEIRMYLWVSEAIRLDILLISLVLSLLYGSAAVLLYARRWLRTAALLAAVLTVICGGMSYKWIEVGREGQRVSEAAEEGNRLLFKAKFRDRDTYERLYGPLTGDEDDYPVGHWRIEGQSRFTRMIINAEGRVWLFYQCQEDAECHSGPAGSGLGKTSDDPQQWAAQLNPQVGLPFDIELTRTGADALSVSVRDQTHRFTKAPPPIDAAPPPQSLRFLGSYSNLECIRSHAKVRQIWLWRDGKDLYGIGVFSTLVAGRLSLFIRPVVIGKGARDGEGWRFAWQQDDRSGTAMIVVKGNDAILNLDQNLDPSGRTLEDADQLLLKAGVVFSDERIELAPLTNGRDWQHWFDNILVGHFTSGHVPACASSAKQDACPRCGPEDKTIRRTFDPGQ